MPAIETEGLTKLYGAARGIEDVTFSVEAGEVLERGRSIRTCTSLARTPLAA